MKRWIAGRRLCVVPLLLLAFAAAPEAAAQTLSINSPSVTEGNSGSTNLTFTVTLSAASSQQVTVDYADATTGTATSGTDYTTITGGTLTFTAGTTSQTFNVSVTGDTTVEANETVVVTLSNATNATISTATGTGTITNDDGPTISIDSPSVREGNSGTTQLFFTFTLSEASTQTVRVSWAVDATSTATVNVDYVDPGTGIVTFHPGTTSLRSGLRVRGDIFDEEDETLVLRLSNATNATIATATGTGTITDDDATPSINLTVDDSSVGESDEATTITVTATLDGTSRFAADRTVTVSVAGSGAASAVDFAAVSDFDIEIAAGAASGTGSFTLTPTADALDETNETVTVSGASGSLTVSSATITLTDDDAIPSLSVDSPSVTEGDSGSTNLTFTATLSAASGKEVTVDWARSGGGTATSGTDYAAITGGTLTFPAETTSQTFNVSVTGDTIDESNETVVVFISNAANATLATVAGTGTIIDDDGAPALSIDSPSVTEGDSGSKNLTFTVTLIPASTGQVTVNYADAGTGTATSGTDYTAITAGTLTFAAGTTSRTFDVSMTGDTLDESIETVVVTLSGATGATIATATGTGTIIDDDGAPTLSIDSPSVTEGDSGTKNLTFTVTLSPASSQRVTVNYADGRLAGRGGTATSGTDYVEIRAGRLDFPVGTTNQTFNVAVRGDTIDELNETVVVLLGRPSNAVISSTAGAGTGTITDDDEPSLTLTVDDGSVGEGDGATTITVTATVDGELRFSAPTTVTVSVAGSGVAGVVDFATVSSFDITIPANAASGTGTFTLTPTNDALDEANETVTVSGVSGSLAVKSATITVTDNDATPTLSIDSPTLTEGDSGSKDMTFTVTLSAASGQQVRVNYADASTDNDPNTVSGTATSGTDYTAITGGKLTFAAGTTSQTFDVSVTGDTTDEANETVVVTLSGATGATIATASGTGTITDDDAAPTISISSPSLSEEDADRNVLQFIITLSAVSGKEVTVYIDDAVNDSDATNDGTATSGDDYTATTRIQLDFRPGTNRQGFSIEVLDDTMDEPNETLVLTLSDATNATIATASGTGTITDDDDPPTLSINSQTVTEGDDDDTTSVEFTVALSESSGKRVTVGYALAGTATFGTDYDATAADTVTFDAGINRVTIAIEVTGDTTDELDETIVITLSSAVNATIATGTGTVTITDDDGPTVSIDSPSVTEGNAGDTPTLTFTVTLDEASVQPVTVAYADAGSGTATSGTDYTAIAGGTLTFAAGATSQTFDVSVTGDTTDEAGETVVVTLSDPTNATIATATGTGTITNDDGPMVSIDSPSVTEGDSDSTTLTFTVTLSEAGAQRVTVDYADAGTGTATSGTATDTGRDYTAITGGTLTFPVGTTSQTFDVSVTGDTTNELNETIVITLSNAANAAIATGTGTGTITNDDGTTLSINSPSVTEGDSGTTNLTFTVTLSATTAQQVTVNYADATTGTATSGTDYTAITDGTLTFAAGTTSLTQTFNVAVTGDTTDEANETVVVTLSGATGATIATATGTGTINDNDAMPTLSVNSPSVTEGDSGSTNLTFTATLSAASGRQVTVAWAEGTGGTATSGTDYTAITGGTLTFAAGTTSQTFNVAVTGDILDESDETVVVTLSSPTNATVSNTAGSGTGTITDDDAEPSITLTVDKSSVGEGDGATLITVTATVDGTTRFAAATTVPVSVGGSGDTATSGVDYEAVSNFDITIAAGAVSDTGSFTLTPMDDPTDERDETITVSRASGTLTVNSATISLTDNDGAPRLSINSPSVAEGDSGSTDLTFTVTLSPASAQQVTVDYADAGTGTATGAGTDYTAITGATLTFAAGTTSQTFTVAVTGDTLDEANETVVVPLSNPTNATISDTAGTGTGTITDDDATPTLSINSPSVAEGDSGSTNLTFTVTLSAASGRQVTVAYADATTGTATSGTDYTTFTGGTLTFTAGTTSQTFNVAVTGDTTDEANETVVVTLSGATNATNATGTGTGTITDDDGPTVSIDSPSVTEGNSGATTLTFTATLSAASAQQVTVDYADAGSGTATSGTDYTAITAGTLTFAVGTTSQTFNVAVTVDTLDELNETVVVTLSDPTNATIATGTGTGTITDDDGPTVSIDSPSVTEGDSGSTNLTFTVTLSATSVQPVTVAYADATTGTATSGTDYRAITGGTLTFAAGTTSQTFNVAVTGDTTDEANETVIVTLSSPTSATIATGTGTGTITDDDGPTLSIDSPSVAEGDSGSTNLTFRVTLSAASVQPVTVAWAEGTGGTATSGTDYPAITGGTLAFRAGTTSQTFNVAVTGDTTDETNETVIVTLSSPTNATITTGAGTGTITDDDGPALSIDSPSVAEGNSGSTNLTFTVSLSAASVQPVTVAYADAGTGTATSGTDYTALTAGTLTFPVGTTSQTFNVAVTGDTTDETNETVVVTLSSPTNATISTGTGTVTITDDDGPMLSINSPSVTEGDSGSTNLTFTVTLSATSVQPVTVGYTDAETGTATSGTDYTAITGGTLTFTAGTTSQTFNVAVTGDTTDEANETIVVTLSSPTNATIATGAGTGTITDDDGPTVSIDSPSVTEGDSGSTNLTFTVSLSAASAQQVTVAYADAGTGTATSGTDYEAITGGTLTFPAGTTSQTFNVAVTGDTTDEANETVVVTLSSPTNATISTANGTGTITNDDEPTVSVNSLSVTEGDSGSTNLTFTATLSAASVRQVTVAYADAGTGTATSGTDYTAITAGTLTFTAGTTSQTFNVAVTGDTTDETNETVVVTLSSPTSATIATGAGTGTITDDDGPTVSIDSPSVTEGDSGSTNLTFTVTLSAASVQQVMVDYADATTGTATSGTDYTAITAGTLTFAAGTTSQTFNVSVLGDALDEANETVVVTLSTPTNATISTGTGTGTITDDDATPTLSIDSPSVAEGDSGSTNLTFTVTLSAASGQQVTVAWAEGTGGTATSGTDYTAITGGTLTFTAGTTSQTFDVAVTGDVLDEENETIVATLSNAANATISTASGTGTITDDDRTPSITLTVDKSSVGEGDGATLITVTATVDGTTRRAAATTVTVSVAGSGTATAVDFTAVSDFDITIGAGAASQTGAFTLTPTDDTADETDETITVSGASGTLTVNSATLSLTDNDGAPTLSINSPSVTEGDSGSTNLTFTVTLSPASGQQVTVAYADAGTGTATSGTDYTAITGGTLTFAAGTTSQTFNVSVLGDTLDEANETVVVTLSSPTNAAISSTVGTGTGTITDDDATPTLSIDSPSVAEGDSGSTTMTFTVRLSAASGRQVTVAYADATTGTATAGTDYEAITGGTLTFTAGTTSQTFNVSATGDTTDEVDETVVVSLSGATNATVSAMAGAGTGTITDDDGPAVSIDSPSVTEGDSGSTNLTFTATLSAASGQQVTVDWGAGTGGSATSGTDYTAITGGTLTFTAGTTSQTFTVAVTGDTTDELNETVVVTLSDPTNATIATGTGTGTITDDDGPAVSIDSPSVTEGDSGSTNLTFTVTLSATSVQPVTVAYADAGTGTATSGTDYEAITAGTLTFPVGTTSQTFTVAVTGDTTDEANETIVVTLSSPTNATISTASGTGTITDDDGPAVSVNSPSVTEGDSGSTNLTFTATLSAASVQQVTVDWGAGTGGSATSGTDYTAITGGTLTFTAGTTSQTFNVAVTGDTTDELNETVVVTLSGPTNATIATGTGTGTITDDDGPTVSIDSPSVTEGDSGSTNLTFTVTLSAASVQQVTVAYADAGTGTATSGTDYEAITGGTLTFPVGTTSQTFNVAVTGDTTDESNETVVVTLSSPTNATISTANGTGTITNDDGSTVSIDSPSVTEGDSGSTNLTFTVTLSAASARQVTVGYTDAGTGTATSGTDYTAITDGTLTFTAGTTSQTFNVSVTGDTTDEANETVVVTLGGATNATIAAGAGTGTITDDDDPPTLSIDAPSMTEGDSGTATLTFTVTLSEASGQQVTVAYADAGTGTATSGTDYTVIPAGTLTFAAGTTSRTIAVTVAGDVLDEADETIALTLSNPVNTTLATATATGTVTDDDAMPTLAINSPSEAEGTGATGGTLTFTVSLSAASGRQVTVAYADAGAGTAISGADYTAITGGTLTFAAGTTTQTIDVSVTGDTADEADETVVVTLSNAANATISTASGTGTITDDDGAPTVSIDSPSVTEGDSGSAALTFTATLSAASGKDVTVQYADATTGTATSGTDYTAITGGTLTFAAGTTSQSFDVSVTGDTLVESNETVVVTLSGETNATLATATGTGTITNDDGPALSVDSPSVNEGDSGSANLTFTVTLSAASGQQVTVDWAEGTGGAATSGTDYEAITGGTLTFAAGTTTQTIDVSVTGDTTDEADETVVVTLSNAAYATIGTATGTGTITDDDGAPTVSIDSPSVMEGDSGSAALTFTVTLSAASGREVTVQYADATTGTATSGTDYTAITGGTLTFAAGTTSQTIAVTVAGDVLDEADETIVVTLSNAANATIGTATGTGTITDDDDADLRVETTGPGATTRTVNGHTVTVVEGDGVPVGVVVLLPVALDRDVVLRFAPPAPGVPFESARFGLGETPDRRTVVDVTADPIPSGGVELCLPVVAALREEAGERGLRLLHYGASGWAAVARSRDDAARGLVCASGVTELSPFAVGYGDLMPSFGGAQVPAQRYVQGLEIDPLVLPAATGGDGPLAYALAPALPDGLGYTAPADARSGGALAGTPTVPAQAAAWTLTATDADGDTAALTFTIEVAPDVSDLMPSFGDAQVPAQRYVQGLEIDPLVLPAATGGDGPLAYALAPALPDGLEYTAPADATSGGALAGTPAAPAQAAAWTLTATDADGDRATLTFTIEVAPDLMPSFGDAQVPAQRYVQGLEIDPLVLPAATGGDGPLAYTLAPALPDGLGYTAPADARSGGALTGTPAAPAQAAAWTLTATDADGDTATLTFTIEVLDRLRVRLKGVNEALLPDLSRAMTASTMDAVAGRIGQALSPDGAGAPGAMASADVLTGLAGLLQANEQALEDGTWSWKQALDGRRFALALSGAGGRDGAGGGTATGLGADPATDTGARVTVWGAGDYRNLAGGEGSAVDWDGHLFGAHLGMDARFGAGGLAGLALSVSKGSFDYTDTSAYALGKVEGEYESRMTSAHPYVGWAWPAGRHAWASLGYGRGDVTLIDGEAEAGRQTSDSTLRSAAAGGSVRVLTGEGPGFFGPVTVDLKGEAWTTRLAVEDNGERIAGLAVRTHRLRVAAEGARAFALSGGGLFTPSVELGMRLDRGDGETGAGVELGGGLDYAHPALGLRADVAGRVLLAHEGETEDWSVGGSVRLEPASGRGLSLRLAPSYGETGSGLARLWEGGVAGSGAGATGAGTTGSSPTARLDTEMGYGLAAFAGVLTPYGGLELSEGGTRGYRLGARFLLGPAFELGLEGERRESRPERAEHGLMLRGRVRW